MNNHYKVVNDQWVELLSGEFEGIVYKYGRVTLKEENDALRIQFEYMLPGGRKIPPEREKGFVNHVGPILAELIELGVMKNNIVYTGGIDEN